MACETPTKTWHELIRDLSEARTRQREALRDLRAIAQEIDDILDSLHDAPRPWEEVSRGS